ncbi:hypothetical protein IV203_018222 [Nitzschia inconspicua]|uniref:Uncharacterized protein n=1 Tax=Nitzschia inconspicua TaxID=303405 RepID=A0A9K3M135_9STRA|nr:hypothetical protein IV203_018222 [Nitzschia inconspicua]
MACAALTKTLEAHAGSVVPEVAGLEELSALMEASSPSTSPRFRPDQQINEDPPVDSRPFIMHPKHASIHNMYCEWHGISPFADPQGGVNHQTCFYAYPFPKEPVSMCGIDSVLTELSSVTTESEASPSRRTLLLDRLRKSLRHYHLHVSRMSLRMSVTFMPNVSNIPLLVERSWHLPDENDTPAHIVRIPNHPSTC